MIFYFSGTGNSRYAAQKLARRGERVISMAEAMKNIETSFELAEDERLGFVFPTYFWGLPTLVVNFVRKLTLSGPGRHYVYSLALCGGYNGRANKQLALLLREKGISVNAEFGLRMVDSFIPLFKVPPTAKIEQILLKADEQLEEISGHIEARASGHFNPYAGPLPGVIFRLCYGFYKRGRKTKYFTVDDSCIGCKVCEQSCPSQAIRYYNKRPQWVKDCCSLCMGCVHLCPVEAINYRGMTEGKKRYYNSLRLR